MRTVALIACVASKNDTSSKAIDLYKSPLFKKSIAYCNAEGVDCIYILSALYGLVRYDAVIEPYNLTLNDMTAKQRREWTGMVVGQLKAVENIPATRFVVMAGMKYREHLIKSLSNYEVPMQGLGIGYQLQWLDRNTSGGSSD